MSDQTFSAADQLPLTVADALRLPVLREGVPEVLAGDGQLNRTIRWVASGEFPDMPAVLKGGELLLTHGMSIPASAARRRRYLADLARVGIAGLVIELGSGVSAVPPELVQEARARQLPLIVLHRPIPWVEVTETIHSAIMGRQGALLQRGQDLHQRFLAQLTDGAGVAEILRSLADAVANPVVLSHDGEAVYCVPRELGDARVTSAWEEVARGLPTAPPTLALPVAAAGDPHWGLVSIVALQRPIEAVDLVALQQAAPILALAFLRANETAMLAARDRGDFLELLVDGSEPLEEHHAYRRAASIGFSVRTSWLLPLAADLAAGFGHLDERRWALIGRELRDELSSRRTPAVVGMLRKSEHIALVLGLGAADQRGATARAVAQMLERAVGRNGNEAPVVVCAGPATASWRELRDALRETVEAVPAMRHAPQQPWHDVSGPSLRRLLWTLRHNPALEEFASRSVEPLAEYDARRGSELLATLSAYCACGGSKAEAARTLNLERQSMYKRLARIEALLGTDLDDEDTRLGLHLALRVRAVL